MYLSQFNVKRRKEERGRAWVGITRGTNSFPTRPTCPTTIFINWSVFLSCSVDQDRAVPSDYLMACVVLYTLPSFDKNGDRCRDSRFLHLLESTISTDGLTWFIVGTAGLVKQVGPARNKETVNNNTHWFHCWIKHDHPAWIILFTKVKNERERRSRNWEFLNVEEPKNVSCDQRKWAREVTRASHKASALTDEKWISFPGCGRDEKNYTHERWCRLPSGWEMKESVEEEDLMWLLSRVWVGIFSAWMVCLSAKSQTILTAPGTHFHANRWTNWAHNFGETCDFCHRSSPILVFVNILLLLLNWFHDDKHVIHLWLKLHHNSKQMVWWNVAVS